MKTRTTMTLDADNARRLARLQKERDLSWKEAVNTVIRRGLDEAERPFVREPFETPVFHGTEPAFKTTEELKDLVEKIQREDDLAKLGLK
ncbi:MAG TPA: hypothetical protein VHZ78_09925 [Rhizomicrobium sp.]|jgi:hypothetical protein|nr:hypothetical protein [Rhizomicrobium sp.]